MGKQKNPDQLFVKLKYADQKIVAPVGPTIQIDHTGNGLIDPNRTVSGTENPLGFIEWMAFYARFEVHGSRCNFLLYNSSQTIGIFYCLYPSFGNISIADYPSNTVQPYAISGVVGQEPSGNNLANMTAYMSTRKLWGRQTYDTTFAGNVTTNPLHLWLWSLFVISQGGTLPPLFTMQVRIVYYVKFFDRNKLLQEASPALMLAALENAKRHGVLASASEMNTNENPPPPGQCPKDRFVKPLPVSAYRMEDLPIRKKVSKDVLMSDKS